MVWELATRKIIAELKGHKFGVRSFPFLSIASFLVDFSQVGCVAFSPNGKWLVSMGFERDQMLEVWDWREQKSLACNKVLCPRAPSRSALLTFISDPEQSERDCIHDGRHDAHHDRLEAPQVLGLL